MIAEHQQVEFLKIFYPSVEIKNGFGVAGLNVHSSVGIKIVLKIFYPSVEIENGFGVAGLNVHSSVGVKIVLKIFYPSVEIENDFGVAVFNVDSNVKIENAFKIFYPSVEIENVSKTAEHSTKVGASKISGHGRVEIVEPSTGVKNDEPSVEDVEPEMGAQSESWRESQLQERFRAQKATEALQQTGAATGTAETQANRR